MIRFHSLGGIRLASGGRELTRVVAQPKRLALLAVLAARLGAFRRRDTLLALLWPEMETARARAALRNSLYFLRRHLGDEIIRTRGAEDVGLDPRRFWYDAAEFESAVRDGRHSDALALYGGDLLPGFFLSESHAFDEWLEAERTSLRKAAIAAATATAEACAMRGDLREAIAAAERACDLSPYDEDSARRLISLLDSNGDRAGALLAFARFGERLARDLGATASPETQSLVDSLRQRELEHEHLRPDAGVRPKPPADPATEPFAPPSTLRSIPRRVAWQVTIGVIGVIGVLFLGGRMMRSQDSPLTTGLVVMPLLNATGDTALDYLAEGLAFTTSGRLTHLAGLHITAGGAAPSLTNGESRHTAEALGGAAVLNWSLNSDDSALVVKAEITRVSDGVMLWSCECPLALPHISPIEDLIVQAVSDRFSGRQVNGASREPETATPESRLLYLKARYYWSRKTRTAYWHALRLLERAIDEDPGSAQAYSWLSNTYGAMAVHGHLPVHEAFRRSEASARRALELNGDLADAHASLGAIRFLYNWDWDAAERELLRAIELDPEYAEAHSVLAHLYQALGRYDEALLQARDAARFDPLSPYYQHHVGIILACAGKGAAAIRQLRSSLGWDPSMPVARQALVSAWAHAGQPDSALSAWFELARRAGDSATANLVTAHRSEGYTAVARAVASYNIEAARLASLEGEFVSPMRLVRAHAEAGDREASLAGLLQAVAARDPQVLYMRCDPALDSLRDDPRFEVAARRIGLPQPAQ